MDDRLLSVDVMHSETSEPIGKVAYVQMMFVLLYHDSSYWMRPLYEPLC